MANLSQRFGTINTSERELLAFVAEIVGDVQMAEYTIAEINDQKPWGAYIRIQGDQAERFIGEFFPGLQLDLSNMMISPKILIVAPDRQLSWRFHNRRDERWLFLTPGAYYKSQTDEQGDPVAAQPGDVAEIHAGDRHRLVSLPGQYTIVAEIWQHLDPEHPSDEDDIVRLNDDYQRSV